MSVSGTPQPTPRLPPRRILEDASGRRLRRMRWVGRATALLFLVWLAIVIFCYFPCKWFAGVKQRNKSPWLSYL